MSRYEEALVRYEQARQSIDRASRMIAFWAARIGEKSDCGKQYWNSRSCIERLWDANKNNKIFYECECCVFSEDGCTCRADEYIEPPKLCSDCRNTQRFVDLRKRRKQEFGAAKRQISALAKTLIKS